MASYQIEWKRSAAKELQTFPAVMIKRIVEAVTLLADNPFPYGVTKLVGSEQTYRIRVGNYRVVYSVYQAALIIEIVRVAHRREVYR